MLDRSGGYTVVMQDRAARWTVDERLRDRLVAIGPSSRLQLLRVLDRPNAQPRTLIGALYPSAEFKMLSDLLIDLEADLPTDRPDHRSERSWALENVVVIDPDSTSSDDDWIAVEVDIA